MPIGVVRGKPNTKGKEFMVYNTMKRIWEKRDLSGVFDIGHDVGKAVRGNDITTLAVPEEGSEWGDAWLDGFMVGFLQSNKVAEFTAAAHEFQKKIGWIG